MQKRYSLFLCFLSGMNISLYASESFNAAPPIAMQEVVEHSKDGKTTSVKAPNGTTHVFDWFPKGGGFTVRTSRSYAAVITLRNKSL